MVRAGATQELVVVLSRPLGLVLAEQPGGTGAVLVESLAPGGNAETAGTVFAGDVIAAAGPTEDSLTACTSFDATLAVLGGSPDSAVMTLKLLRAVKEAPGATVTATVAAGPKASTVVDVVLLPGTVVRDALLASDVQLYNAWGAAMNCGGGGSCGTCIIDVLQGADHLSARSELEAKKLKGKPASFRLACQTVCEGRGDEKLSIQTMPK